MTQLHQTLVPKAFLLYLSFTVTVFGDDCRSVQFQPQTKNEVLENHVIRRFTVPKQSMCELSCYQEPNCVSYNYGPVGNITGTKLCELNDRNHLQASSGEFVSKEDYTYREVLNFCQSSPCPSNATCQSGYTTKHYRCNCQPGYRGDHCEKVLDVDECAENSHNCSLYSDCCNLVGSFQCICKPDYTGDGISCTGNPPVAVACVSLTLSEAAKSYQVNADQGSFNTHGFCRVVPKGVVSAGVPYTMTVHLLNVIGSGGVHFGHPGVIYNVIDENNFDFMYFRSHSTSGCYQPGYMLGGVHYVAWSSAGACPRGPPPGAVWFTVSVVVSSDKSVSIFLNDALVTSLTARFDTRGRGGVLVANGYANIIQFRNFCIREH